MHLPVHSLALCPHVAFEHTAYIVRREDNCPAAVAYGCPPVPAAQCASELPGRTLQSGLAASGAIAADRIRPNPPAVGAPQRESSWNGVPKTSETSRRNDSAKVGLEQIASARIGPAAVHVLAESLPFSTRKHKSISSWKKRIGCWKIAGSVRAIGSLAG